MTAVEISPEIQFSNTAPISLIAGINVLESEELAFQAADVLSNVCKKHQRNYVFKASFDKANRSSVDSFRGPGMAEGLKILAAVKEKFQVPVITDIHEPEQAAPVAEVADIVQIPAFLCRQTDLIKAAAATNKPLLIKKMQMMAPMDVKNIYTKLESLGHRKILICERGVSFGYNNLIVDPLAFPMLKELAYPVVFDVTHSLQQPGGLGKATAGRGAHAESLALAAASQGIAGLFLETHPDPKVAKCDGPCATPLAEAEALLDKVFRVDDLVKSF